MNAEFYEHSNESVEDALFDLFIDQLHHFAETRRSSDYRMGQWLSG